MTIGRYLLAMLAVLSLLAIVERGESRAHDCEIGAFGCGHTEQHHEYEGWKTRNGASCCSNEDCRPVRARLDDDGWSVWIPEFVTPRVPICYIWEGRE